MTYKNPKMYNASTVYVLLMLIIMLSAVLIFLLFLYFQGFAPIFCQDYTYDEKGEKLCLTPVKDYNETL